MTNSVLELPSKSNSDIQKMILKLEERLETLEKKVDPRPEDNIPLIKYEVNGETWVHPPSMCIMELDDDGNYVLPEWWKKVCEWYESFDEEWKDRGRIFVNLKQFQPR